MAIDLKAIENLTAEGLKENGPGLVKEFKEAMQAGGVDESAMVETFERFIRARFDAKLRDVTLSGQGKTIDALQQGATAAQQYADALNQRHEELKTKLREMSAEVESLRDQLGVAQKATTDQEQRANAAERLAKLRRVALVDVMNTAGLLNQKVAPLLIGE